METNKVSPKSLGIRIISFLIALFVLVSARFALTFFNKEVAPEPTPVPTTEPTIEPTIPEEWRRDFSLNETAATPNFDITCQKVYLADSYIINNYHVCVIEIEITNTSGSPLVFSTPTDLKCYSDGVLRSRHLILNTLNLETINSGETICGNLAYIVPPTTTQISLEYNSVLNQDTYSFTLDLYPSNP